MQDLAIADRRIAVFPEDLRQSDCIRNIRVDP